MPPPRRAGAPDSGVDPAMLADVSTILLLGGDAGPGRSGLRTDSMILVSVHRPTGRAALISVPRNLEHLLFPPETLLARRYPNGFNDIANAVYPRVSGSRELRDAYSIEELSPGAVAIAQGGRRGFAAPLRTLRLYHQTAHLLGVSADPATNSTRLPAPRPQAERRQMELPLGSAVVPG